MEFKEGGIVKMGDGRERVNNSLHNINTERLETRKGGGEEESFEYNKTKESWEYVKLGIPL